MSNSCKRSRRSRPTRRPAFSASDEQLRLLSLSEDELQAWEIASLFSIQ